MIDGADHIKLNIHALEALASIGFAKLCLWLKMLKAVLSLGIGIL